MYLLFVPFVACLQGWIQFNSDCYLLVKEVNKNWTDAEVDCLDRNSELVYIVTSAEDQFIFSEILNKSIVYEAFIGLKISGHFLPGFTQWSNEANVGFTNWQGGSPGIALGYTSCVVKMRNGSGQWAVRDCGLPKPYICKRKGVSIMNSFLAFLPGLKRTENGFKKSSFWKTGRWPGWYRVSVLLFQTSLCIPALAFTHFCSWITPQGLNSTTVFAKKMPLEWKMNSFLIPK